MHEYSISMGRLDNRTYPESITAKMMMQRDLNELLYGNYILWIERAGRVGGSGTGKRLPPLPTESSVQLKLNMLSMPRHQLMINTFCFNCRKLAKLSHYARHHNLY